MDLSKGDRTQPVHRYLVGEIEVIVVPDGERTAPVPEGFVLNAPTDEVRSPTWPTASRRARGTRRSTRR